MMFIVAMLVVVTLQGVSQGKIVLAETDRGAAAVVTFLDENNTGESCCEGNLLIDSIPTFCKVDCKALVPLFSHRCERSHAVHAAALVAQPADYRQFVDLRPPIS